MAQLGRAATADDILIELHGRRLGIVGDGQSGDPSAIVLDGQVVASKRNPIMKIATSLSGAGAVTLTGAVVGDAVISVTDQSSDADVTSSFEGTISVAGQIQQNASTSGHAVYVVAFPRS